MDKINEQLSALVDDELGEAERALVMKRLAADPEYAGRLSRYHLISQAIKGQVVVKVDLADRVAAAISAENTASPVPAKPLTRLERLSGLAIAASVALVAILVVNTLPEKTAPVELARTAIQPRWQLQNVSDESRLNAYLVKHNQVGMPVLQGASNIHLVGFGVESLRK